MTSHGDDNPTTQRTRLSPGPRHMDHHTACLVVIHGEGLGKRVDLDQARVVIGRSPEADLHIPHGSVSREHCEVRVVDGRFEVIDLQATNRTQLNETPIERAELADGDHLTIGETILKFISRQSVEASYHEEVYQLATHDALTGLYNRRQFIEMMEREVARALRHGRSLSLCMIDVDLFKPINDEHGHIAGDGVLRQLAGVLARHVRGDDVAGRIGGEEFAVMLPEAPGEPAHAFAERLRAAVAAEVFHPGGTPCQITVSIGIASLGAECSDRSALMGAADRALYRAKSKGRNRVESSA